MRQQLPVGHLARGWRSDHDDRMSDGRRYAQPRTSRRRILPATWPEFAFVPPALIDYSAELSGSRVLEDSFGADSGVQPGKR
jgi:hypothetical protein